MTAAAPERLLTQFGAWQVREDGVRCPYRDVRVGAEELRNFSSMSKVSMRLLRGFGFNGISPAEEQDMVDALDWATRWYMAPEKVRRGWRPDLCPATEPKPPADRPYRRSIPNRIRFMVMKRDGYRCQLCGRTANDGVQLDIDHKIPWSKGGSSQVDNLWVLCNPCNSGKSAQEL